MNEIQFLMLWNLILSFGVVFSFMIIRLNKRIFDSWANFDADKIVEIEKRLRAFDEHKKWTLRNIEKLTDCLITLEKRK